MNYTHIPMLLALATPLAAAADGPPDEPGSFDHAVSSDRLRAIMEDINRSIQDDSDGGTVPGAVDPAQLAQLTGAVEELLYHAELMSAESAPRQLTDSAVVTFRALASQLYTEALNVKSLAGANPATTHDFNLLNAGYERLYQTCTACHDLFRDR